MLITASNLIGKPIITAEEKEIVGNVFEIIVSPENGKVEAFLSKAMFKKPHVVSEQDVLDVGKNGVIINDAQALILPSEIIKVNEIIKKKIKILNAKAVTKSKKKLGVVEDFVIETDTAQVVKFYIKGGLFLPARILSSDNVIKIEKNRIIFQDEVLEKLKPVSRSEESIAA